MRGLIFSLEISFVEGVKVYFVDENTFRRGDAEGVLAALSGECAECRIGKNPSLHL